MSAPQRDLTLAEVADLRRFTPRDLRDLIRRYGIPVLRSGRLIRFDASALAALEEALRQPCPSRSSAAPTRAPSPSRALSPASAFAAALRATIPNSPPKRQPHSKPSCSEPPGMAKAWIS